jgi:hypothetical protein
MDAERSQSRTFELNKKLVGRLSSRDYKVRQGAINELPPALTPEELSEIGVQVFLSTESVAYKKGSRLENVAILAIGSEALIENEDLVTAENAAKYLKRRHHKLGRPLLRQVKCTKKRIIKDIMNIDE